MYNYHSRQKLCQNPSVASADDIEAMLCIGDEGSVCFRKSEPFVIHSGCDSAAFWNIFDFECDFVVILSAVTLAVKDLLTISIIMIYHLLSNIKDLIISLPNCWLIPSVEV